MLISEKGIPKSPPVLCFPERDTAQPPPGVQQREQPAPDPAVQRLEQPGGLPRCGMPHMQSEAGTGSRLWAAKGRQEGSRAWQRADRADLPCLFTAGVRDHGCVLGMRYWASCVGWLRPTHARMHGYVYMYHLGRQWPGYRRAWVTCQLSTQLQGVWAQLSDLCLTAARAFSCIAAWGSP